jgi:phage-related minor tail protein
MAGNIKGITIEIGGDTTGLDKALKGVNSQAKAAQSELKEVNKALKLDPGNVELLEQKQRSLADAVSATSEKLDILKEAQKQAADQLARGEIGQEQYDALTREIVKTEAELKKATKEADNFSVTLEKAKTSLNKVGSAAQEVADKTKKMSMAAGGALTAIGGLALKSAKNADELNTLSKQTGITTDDLQKMQYASELVDVSVESMTGAMTKMKKGMADGDFGKSVFETLGVAVRDANGELRNSNEVFYEVLTALSNVTNETERDTLAMEVFGKSADQLAGIIDDGGAALKAYGDEAENLGLILDTETLTSLNGVNDTIDKLKAQAGAELAKAGAEALEALTPVLETVIEKLSQLFEWIGNLDQSQMETIITILAVVAAISPIAGIIATICGAITSFLTIWPQVQAVGAAIKAFALANPMALVVAAVILLGTIIAANWDKIRPILEAAWEKVKTVFDNIKQKIETAMQAVKGVFETVKTAILGVWDGLVNGIKSKINTIIGFFNKLITKVNGLANKANGVLGYLGVTVPTIPQIPYLAQGGVVSSGSAVVGEAGAELLTMKNGQAHVQPLATTTNTYNTYNNTSRQPVQVNLVLDGMVAAKALYDPLKAVGVQRGPAFVTE